MSRFVLAAAVLGTAGTAVMPGCWRRAAMNRPEPYQYIVGDEDLNASSAASFARTIALSIAAQAEMARMATTRGNSDAVRALGSTILSDHLRMSDDLANIAREMSLPMPVDLLPQQRQDLDWMAGAQGAEFDRLFLRAMLREHAANEALLEQHAGTGADPRMRAFSGRWLPVERAHRREAAGIVVGQ
jgi:putative membrane protein